MWRPKGEIMTLKVGRTILVGWLLLLTSSILSAQTPLGRLAGLVRDGSGAVIPNANVTATNDGTSQKQSAKTSSIGTFTFAQLPVGTYTVKVDAPGFRSASYMQVKIDPGKEYSLTATMEIGKSVESVEVVAGAELVNTTTPQVSETITQNQVLSLPQLNRDVTDLFRMQPGIVGIPTRTTTGINGGRAGWTTVTQDGINIQDNFLRENALNFLPNRPTSDSIGEFTITTNNQGADASGGSSQIKMITPAGTNKFHGSLYEFNRNNKLRANDWFNNNATDENGNWAPVKKPFLNQNQFGGRIGGPILKDKLFFSGYYEGYRQAADATQTATVAANDDYYKGVFRYVDTQDHKVRQINVLEKANGGAGLALDPTIQKTILSSLHPASVVNTYTVGDSYAGTKLNTAGYQFNQKAYSRRDQYSVRLDYNLNSNHAFEFIHSYVFEHNDRNDIDVWNPKAQAYNESRIKFFVGAWRWAISPRLQNELRVGANLTDAPFGKNESNPGFFMYDSSNVLDGLNVTTPTLSFMPQGRKTDTYNYIDNASYQAGRHSLAFGGSFQVIKVNSWVYDGTVPTVYTGFDNAPASALDDTQFEGGISAADLAKANGLAAFLSGTLSRVDKSFEVTSKKSGYVPNVPNRRRWSYNDLSFYGIDQWKLNPRFTVTLGLKWEYFSPVKEADGLTLLAVASGTPMQTVLNQNASIDWAKGGLWNGRKNNFAPSVGFAWDPFGEGKTAIRAGYTLAYVNDSNIRVADNATSNNNGLEANAANYDASGTLTSNLSASIPTAPAFTVPRTLTDQLRISATSGVYTIDPDLKQPYVHQFSFGIEHEINSDTSVEIRYVGQMAHQLYRGVDYNQTNAGTNAAYLADFARARSNGYLALAAKKGFAIQYDPAVPGSQPLTILPTIGAGFLTYSSVTTYIQQNAAAELANFYTTYRSYFPKAPGFFLANPNIYVADVIKNAGDSNYNALQAKLTRRMKQGLSAEVGYSFSKTLANINESSNQTRFDPLFDNARPWLEKRISDLHVAHVISADYVYELPFGRGRRFLGDTRVLRDVVGGWQTSSIFHWQTGAPISILSTRGTFNRGGRSGGQSAVSTLSQSEIQKLLKVHRASDGTLYYIDPSVINPSTGRGVGADNLANAAGFKGQVFFNPTAGNTGNLGRLAFTGPSQFTWDMSVKKRTRVTERVNADFAVDFVNILNHPNFYVGDQNINSTTFGRIASMNTDSRIIQMSLRLSF